MTITLVELNTLVQQKIEADSEFQSSLANLSEEEKTAKITERKNAEFDAELGKVGKDAENYQAQKIRAEKAERELKTLADAKKGGNGNDGEMKLSPKDYLSLTEAKISSEDFDEVKDWATYRKVSISEALKDKTLQTVLREKSEQRATDAATATKARRPAVSDPQGADLLQKALRGELLESDEGIDELVQAEHRAKLAKAKR